MASAGRLRVGILFGGRSAEHEVSVISAQGVMAATDAQRFQVVPLGVTKQGAWLTPQQTQAALAAIRGERVGALDDPQGGGFGSQVLAALQQVDVVFPLVHGTYGEDGSLQGLLEMAGIPYVGAGVTASALGMDKSLQQMVFRQAGLPVPDSLTVTWPQWQDEATAVARQVEARLGYPCFVKPANSGSSIGTSKARSREDLADSFAEAFRYDRKALVEQAIEGRQIECSVLGNDDPHASPLGEIVFVREFYDYVAKYDDPNTRLIIPADLPSPLAEKMQALAIAAFKAIDCAGMGRVDFFLTQDGQPYVNEINTIPGFTPMSMYPKLWEAAGLPYRDLITRLVELAIERHQEKQRRA
ncbi:MAG: D-alanine--D-alanine ligase family protein [Chloroflexota bacterium]|nr:D-alanine--D-alanine ligase family protein [Chloroflexota bacterium]